MDGYKTYIVGFLTLCMSVADLTVYDIPNFEGMEMFLLALGLLGIRRGMKTNA